MNFQRFNKPRSIDDVCADLAKMLEANKPENVVAAAIATIATLLAGNRTENIVGRFISDVEQLLAANRASDIVTDSLPGLRKPPAVAALKLPPRGLKSLETSEVVRAFGALLPTTAIEQIVAGTGRASFSAQTTALR
jgi:hypothetical protein